MDVYVPDYYKEFKCIADKCKHTCCKGWEVEVDEASFQRFRGFPDIMEKIEQTEDIHFRLLEDETCPFLLENGLCDMIVKYGQDILCQTCADHPRFRNYWTDRVEMGLGLVCEEAARMILSREQPMKLVLLEADGESSEDATEEELWLRDLRDTMLSEIHETGPLARLREYLIYRHIADALYDDRVEERSAFVDRFVSEVKQQWDMTDGSFEALIEIVRQLSYDVEYDEEVKEAWLEELSTE